MERFTHKDFLNKIILFFEIYFLVHDSSFENSFSLVLIMLKEYYLKRKRILEQIFEFENSRKDIES